MTSSFGADVDKFNELLKQMPEAKQNSKENSQSAKRKGAFRVESVLGCGEN